MTLKEIEKGLDAATERRLPVKAILRIFGCGYISNGIHRSVYSILGTNRYVFKIEHENGVHDRVPNFKNVCEFQNWIWFKGSCYEKWLARCRLITYDGRILVQDRAEPVTRSEMPKKIPPFFTDKKVCNWGRIKGRVVCLDYPIYMPDQGKMKRVIWK